MGREWRIAVGRRSQGQRLICRLVDGRRVYMEWKARVVSIVDCCDVRRLLVVVGSVLLVLNCWECMSVEM